MTPWKTWVTHALLVVPVTVLWSLVLTPVLGPLDVCSARGLGLCLA